MRLIMTLMIMMQARNRMMLAAIQMMLSEYTAHQSVTMYRKKPVPFSCARFTKTRLPE